MLEERNMLSNQKALFIWLVFLRILKETEIILLKLLQAMSKVILLASALT